MKVFRPGEILSEPFRANDPAIAAFDQAAIGLVREEQLAGSPDDNWIDAAENDCEKKRREDRPGGFFNDGIQRVLFCGVRRDEER